MTRFSYIFRRVLLAIPTFLGITLVCFALTRVLPGGPVEMRLAKMRGIGGDAGGANSANVTAVTKAQRQELIRQFGFDQPFIKQYARWLFKDAMGLRMHSYDYPDRTAGGLIVSRFPVSLTFGLTGFVLAYLICIPLGMMKALKHGSFFDASTSVLVFIGYALPSFAFAMLLKMLFCGTVEGFWKIFPLGGIGSPRHYVLPVLCYVIGNFAMLTLLMKNSLMEQISSDYVRTALAKGCTPRRALWGHAFRNSLIPIATGFGAILSVMFAGSVIIERIFDIPGMGRLSLDAIVGRDYAVFMASLTLMSILQLAGNLLSDFSYMLIDPRITFSKQ